MSRPTLAVDIDHTISNAYWRDAMIGGPWDDYHAAAKDDQPLHSMVLLLRALHAQGWQVIGLTARPAKWRKLTMEWMVLHGVPMDNILMRPDEDYRNAPEMKVALAQEYFGAELNGLTMMLDDRDDVVAAFRALNVNVMQVNMARDVNAVL